MEKKTVNAMYDGEAVVKSSTILVVMKSRELKQKKKLMRIERGLNTLEEINNNRGLLIA